MHARHPLDAPAAPLIGFDAFLAVDIRIGTVISDARNASLKAAIDFGPTLGRKRSCAQISEHCARADLVGHQVAAVVNFPPRQIGKTLSEVLTLGFADAGGAVVYLPPTHPCPMAAGCSRLAFPTLCMPNVNRSTMLYGSRGRSK